MSDHEQTLRAMGDEEQSKLDSLPTAKGKGEPTSEAADRFRARRAACLSGADALVRAKQTCGNCKHCEVIRADDHGLCRNGEASAFGSGVDLDDGCIKGWATRED